uniref:Uncharacterized protein n=1 Tax=Heterorhabditis bacteriophora TaxID=37862 RepID=A0A1I7WYR1_HETBA
MNIFTRCEFERKRPLIRMWGNTNYSTIWVASKQWIIF